MPRPIVTSPRLASSIFPIQTFVSHLVKNPDSFSEFLSSFVELGRYGLIINIASNRESNILSYLPQLLYIIIRIYDREEQQLLKICWGRGFKSNTWSTFICCTTTGLF